MREMQGGGANSCVCWITSVGIVCRLKGSDRRYRCAARSTSVWYRGSKHLIKIWLMMRQIWVMKLGLRFGVVLSLLLLVSGGRR